MMEQDARKFAFLDRSGLDKELARRLVNDLEEADADVIVNRDDVNNAVDLQSCVDSISGPIDGVVQAAMSFDKAI